MLVTCRGAGHEHELAVIGERQNIVPHANHIAGSEAFLFPLDFTGGDIHALERTVAVFLEAKHAIQVAIFKHGRAPVVCHMLMARNTPDLLRAPLTTLERHLVRAATHTVTG